MKKKKFLVLGLAVGLLAAGGAVQAGLNFENYSTTVGAFNGSGYTSYQYKYIADRSGTLDSYTVGGNYTVDARMQSPYGGTGSWVRSVTDSDIRSLPNSIAAADDSRVQFSNDLSTPVQVQVSGEWSSN